MHIRATRQSSCVVKQDPVCVCDGPFSRTTEEHRLKTPERMRINGFTSPLRNHYFLVFWEGQTLAFYNQHLFSGLSKSAHPWGPTERQLGLLRARHSATLFAPWQIAISVLPSSHTIHFYFLLGELLHSCVGGDLLLLITVVCFHPRPGPLPMASLCIVETRQRTVAWRTGNKKLIFSPEDRHKRASRGFFAVLHSTDWYLQWHSTPTSCLKKS